MSEREEWINLIRNEYDPKPDLGRASYPAFDSEWDDGAGRIADAIIAEMTRLRSIAQGVGNSGVLLQARPPEGGDWTDIYPAQLEWMAKAGNTVRAIEFTVEADEVSLRNPVFVHMNMLRGGIAKPSWDNIQHLYPEEFEDIANHMKALDAQIFELTRRSPELSSTDDRSAAK